VISVSRRHRETPGALDTKLGQSGNAEVKQMRSAEWHSTSPMKRSLGFLMLIIEISNKEFLDVFQSRCGLPETR
jgi:hypothetical protein